MRSVWLALALALVLVPVATAQTLRYADVRLHLAPGETLAARLAGTGVALDHVARERTPDGLAFRTVLREDELAAVRAAGVATDVLVADLSAQYADRAARAGGCPATPFPITGTHGCYPTFAQTVAILDEMRAAYPALVSEKLSIGTTHEGRDLWMIEIGDNPGVDEGEPEVLLNALHHAREPQGMASLLHAVWTALDGYGSDPEWTYLLDHRRVFVVPVVNPDGYVYNQTTDPAGGGFWRKNRRENGGNVFGVDLNRNYGWEWGYDDAGSSPNPSGETYRGPSAFSEPETQALRDFVSAHDIRIALNTHTYSDLLIYPWGYEADLYTPDSAAFVDAARVMTRVNGYLAGTGNQTVGYLTNGDADDWMYGAEGVLAMTPEIGSVADGFWPSPDRLLPLAEINVDMYRQAIRLAGGAPDAAITAVTDAPGGNGFPDPGETVEVTVEVTNVGRDVLLFDGPAALSSANPNLAPGPTVPQAGVSLAPGERVAVGSFPLSISTGTPLGRADGLSVALTLDGTALDVPLGAIRVGTPVALFTSDASTLDGWVATGGWGLTASPVVSPPSAFTDSPGGDYGRNADARLTLAEPLDLSGVAGAEVAFSARWSIEAGWDFGTVEVSTNGTTWTALAGDFTHPGSGNGPEQPAGVPGVDGSQPAFVREHVSLAAYDGVPALRLRFRLRSDGAVQDDGWIIDDIAVERLTNGGTVATADGPGAGETALGAPSPNPTAGTVRLGVALGATGPVDLAVYDVLGRRVATLRAGDAPAGTDVVTWDGRDSAGRPVAPGLYVVRLVASGATVSRQILVVR